MIDLRWAGRGLRMICALSIASQAACSPPWTIRPLSAESAARFDAVAYVDSIWTEKVVPEATRAAIDLRSTIDAAGPPAGASTSRQQPRSTFVSGTGVITEVDRRSRVGLASIDLIPVDGRPDAAIQVGPVIRGTAVRDALPFIRFTDFANQIDFAAVASELNGRVLSTVLASVAVDDLEGKTVVFHAAMTSSGSSSVRPELVPITLRIAETVR